MGLHKLTIDGSLRQREGYWGMMIRNWEGEVVRDPYGKASGNSIDHIEMKALYFGLRLAKRYVFDMLEINVDSSVVLHYLKSPKPPWEIKHMVSKVRVCIDETHSREVEHCYREANKLVDALAVLGRKMKVGLK